MNLKLEELLSQIAKMELGYRECSAKLLYVKDEMEAKDTKIKELTKALTALVQHCQDYGLEEELLAILMAVEQAREVLNKS